MEGHVLDDRPLPSGDRAESDGGVPVSEGHTLTRSLTSSLNIHHVSRRSCQDARLCGEETIECLEAPVRTSNVGVPTCLFRPSSPLFPTRLKSKETLWSQNTCMITRLWISLKMGAVRRHPWRLSSTLRWKDAQSTPSFLVLLLLARRANTRTCPN